MKNKHQKIGLGGSCHWCTEAIFESLNGINEVQQGWIASTNENESLSEAILIDFDENAISLKTLIEIHLNTHSCTSNHSMREKYRSAVYCFNQEQLNKSEQIIKNLQKDFNGQIITKVLFFHSFKLNIEVQLNYYYKNPEKPFCKNIVDPKLKKLLNQFSAFVNTEKLNRLHKN
ncbi:MAG: peptide-methionine (S)-S-oxide reductase [Flavobacterium sp.]